MVRAERMCASGRDVCGSIRMLFSINFKKKKVNYIHYFALGIAHCVIYPFLIISQFSFNQQSDDKNLAAAREDVERKQTHFFHSAAKNARQC